MSALQRMEPGDPRYAKVIEAAARGMYEATTGGPHATAWDEISVQESYRDDARAALAALEAEGWVLTDTREVERLRKLTEPDEWMGWEQVDSIYEEARLLRRERDDARALLAGGEVERLREAFIALARVVQQNDHHATVRDARPIINRALYSVPDTRETERLREAHGGYGYMTANGPWGVGCEKCWGRGYYMGGGGGRLKCPHCPTEAPSSVPVEEDGDA